MLESLLSTYGYPIIFIGTFLEGETMVVLGGVSAHLGYLSLDRVIICGFFGTFLGDQLFFFLGRRHGKKCWSGARHGRSLRAAYFSYWNGIRICSSLASAFFTEYVL